MARDGFDFWFEGAPVLSLLGGEVSGVAFPTFFYPSITYTGPVTINFTTAARRVIVRTPAIATVKDSYSGNRETLFNRLEYLLRLEFRLFPGADVDAVDTWLTAHALKGLQSAVVLDRLNTCGGQWEYDTYNSLFDKAELINSPAFVRSDQSINKFDFDLEFRQGQ